MGEFTVPQGITNIQPIREIIYEHLRQAIINGEIKPGERLVERDIATKFSASRTPVREALRKLETEGLIEYLARKGVVVRGFNVGEIEEIYSIRKVLEKLAIRSAIKKINDSQIENLKLIVEELERLENGEAARRTYLGLHAFDDLILDAAEMPILKSFLHTLQASLQRFRKINLSSHPRRKDAVKEHKEILQAIISRDIDLAEQLVSKHVDNSRSELKKMIKL